jgi:hypothetical protein
MSGRTFGPLPFAAVGSPRVSAQVAPKLPDPDAELIRICHQFAEEEFRNFYRNAVATDDAEEVKDTPEHLARFHWIEATPASTPAGWCAKALVYAAWRPEGYDDHEDNCDAGSTLLASLLRDMVAPARNAIIARCAGQYGPLGPEYSQEGVWLGYSPEELARIRGIRT